jgi:hypothetical protein
MTLKNAYYAIEKILSSDHHLINYYFNRGETFLSMSCKTRGKTFSLEDISEEEYLKWRLSLSAEDYIKQKEYRGVKRALTLLGYTVRTKFNESHTPLDAEADTEKSRLKGYRKFKPFEEKIFLDILYGNTQPSSDIISKNTLKTTKS